MLALPFATLLIAHLVEVLVLLCALADQLPEVLESTARTRSILAVGNRSGCGVGDEADEVARSVTVDSATLAGHELHADVTEEGDEVSHAPGSCPLWSVSMESELGDHEQTYVDVVGGELLGRSRG